MKFKLYDSLAEAVEDIAGESRNYVFVRHSLKLGEEVKLHYHSKANETIVVYKGAFFVLCGKEGKALNLENKVAAIHFPKKRRHAIHALSPISYFVYRDVDDVIIYCDN